MKVAALFKSRRFWAALVGVAVVVGENLGVSVIFAEELVWLIAAWVVGDSIRETT